jgi:hypothetical protein
VNCRPVLLAGALASFFGCATVRSGSFDLDQDYAELDFPKIKARGSFELRCPKDKLALVTLAVAPGPAGDRANQVGVEGCGQRAVYLRRGEDWELNSTSK